MFSLINYCLNLSSFICINYLRSGSQWVLKHYSVNYRWCNAPHWSVLLICVKHLGCEVTSDHRTLVVENVDITSFYCVMVDSGWRWTRNFLGSIFDRNLLVFYTTATFWPLECVLSSHGDRCFMKLLFCGSVISIFSYTDHSVKGLGPHRSIVGSNPDRGMDVCP